MIIAIPASANKIEALIDERFGRCPYFCFFNTDTDQIDFEENSLRNGAGGVGPQVSEFLANKGIKKVLAVDFGPKANDMLNKLNIQTQTIENGLTVQQVIEKYNL